MAELNIKSIHVATSQLSIDYKKFIVAYRGETNQDIKVGQEN